MLYAFKTIKMTQDNLTKLFCKNSNQKYVEADPKYKAKVPPSYLHDWKTLDTLKKGDEVAWSGFQRNTKSIYNKVKGKYDFYYLDHPYFLHPEYIPEKKSTGVNKTNDKLWGQRYFRVTKNSFNCTTITDTDDGKYKEIFKNEKEHIELRLHDWRKTGSHILVLPPSPTMYDVLGLDKDKILKDTLKIIGENTDREIRVRFKKTGMEGRNRIDIMEDLKDCWAVVSFGTAGAVKAIMNGIPVFCNEYSPTLPVSSTDFSKIETPIYPDREKWLYNLINNQFSFTELNNTNAYEYLNKR